MQTAATPIFAPARPENWRLGLLVDTTSLKAVACSMADASEPVTVRVPLAEAGLANLEEAVYSIPGLLADFRRVDAVWRTSSFTMVPDGLGAEADNSAALLTGIHNDGSTTLYRNAVGTTGAAALWTMPTEISNFLARTFRNPRFHHPLSILGGFFGSRCHRGNCAKLFVHFNGTEGIDLGCFDAAGRLLALTWRRTPTDTDALYFILSFFKTNGLDPEKDEILLCGATGRRQALTPTLRRYVRKVLPLLTGPDAPAAAFSTVLSLTMQQT